MSAANPKPSVFDFLDIRLYLSEFYKYRKHSQAQFSYESWSVELGIKSRSLLRMMVLGQRPISNKFAEVFSYGLGLNSSEIKYFHLLLNYEKAKTKEQKQFFWKQMRPLITQKESRQTIQTDEFVSSHWLPKLQVILTFKDLEKTAANMAEVLGLKESEIIPLLETLEKLSFAKRQFKEGQPDEWHSGLTAFKVPEASQNYALKQYYLRSFDDAKKAISFSPTIRKYRSLLLPLTQTEYEDVLTKLEETFAEILLQHKSDEFKGRSLYQLNMNLIPLSPVSQKLTEPKSN